MAKPTIEPTRSGSGFAIRVDGKAVAWVDGKGGSTIGRVYRATLGDKPVPDDVRAAIETAKARVKRAAKKEEADR